MELQDREISAELRDWIGIAVNGLAPNAQGRVRAEYERHIQEAIDEKVWKRDPPFDAALVVLADLGDPRRANRRLREVYLTQGELGELTGRTSRWILWSLFLISISAFSLLFALVTPFYELDFRAISFVYAYFILMEGLALSLAAATAIWILWPSRLGGVLRVGVLTAIAQSGTALSVLTAVLTAPYWHGAWGTALDIAFVSLLGGQQIYFQSKGWRPIRKYRQEKRDALPGMPPARRSA